MTGLQQTPEQFREQRRREEEERLARLRSRPSSPIGQDGYAAASGHESSDWSMFSTPTPRFSSSYRGSSGGIGGFLIGLAVSIGLTLLIRALIPLIARWMDVPRGIALAAGAILGVLLGAFAVPRIFFPEYRGSPELVLGPISKGEVVAAVVALMFAMVGGISVLIAVQERSGASDEADDPVGDNRGKQEQQEDSSDGVGTGTHAGAGTRESSSTANGPDLPEKPAIPDNAEVSWSLLPRRRTELDWRSVLEQRPGLRLPDRAGWGRILGVVDLVALAVAAMSLVGLITASFFFTDPLTVSEWIDGVQPESILGNTVTGLALVVCAIAIGVHIATDVSSTTMRGSAD